MKDNLLELLMNLFEKTLSQLKEQHACISHQKEHATLDELAIKTHDHQYQLESIAPFHPQALRVFTEQEQRKLTKVSYQFLMRMVNMGVVIEDTLEKVLHRLFFSQSRFVGLQETKWVIRSELEHKLSLKELAFLDLVLYHGEDNLETH